MAVMKVETDIIISIAASPQSFVFKLFLTITGCFFVIKN